MGFEAEIDTNPAVQNNRHYLTVGGQTIGVLVSSRALPILAVGQTAPGTPAGMTLVKAEYWHKDYLGSLVTTTDHAGNVTQRYAYDPFGKRRYTNGNYDAWGNVVVDWNPSVNWGTARGYTGHEHLDAVGLVNMNGRIFDPTLGVFLQGDPFIQQPANLQNYNRYAYCLNNPLTCTDPSGQIFGFDDLLIAAVVIWGAEKAGIIDARTARMFTGIAVSLVLPGSQGLLAQAGVTSGLAQAAISGFVSGAISTGNVKGALQGAVLASAFYGVGSFADAQFNEAAAAAEHAADPVAALDGGNSAWASGGWGRAAMHGVVGCVSGMGAGCKCGSEALSASFSELAVPYAPRNAVQGTIFSAVVGGTASVLGHGKFANGALPSAFGYLFKDWAHRAELAAYGKEAHQLLQGDMEEKGYVVERSCVTPTNCVKGRFDIDSDRTLEVWEIKRNSFFGLGMGELALDAYTTDTGLKRGGDLMGLKVGATRSLWKGFIEYQYTNYGDGLLGYSRFDHTPQQPIRILVPRFGPVPVGSGRGQGDSYGY
ncbi:MAG TPA: RHS repeat-associated core domain-containing protein [Burkholderiaceae bacterium]|nr:RHS repeat-associated core domain-containing protein [Burkholderiaceae bacterium]